METKHTCILQVNSWTVLTDLNRRFVEGVQFNISIAAIDHMGITQTPVQKRHIYITKQYGKTKGNTQFGKNGFGKDAWCFERASSIYSYLQIRIKVSKLMRYSRACSYHHKLFF